MQITIPDSIAEKAKMKGIDVEVFVIEVLLRELDLDPVEEARVHLELAERLLEEGRKLIDSDPIQASEKLYKVAEECIKALAKIENLDEAIEAKKRGRWTLSLLDYAAKKLGEKICEEIYHSWDHAYFLHVEGFHEARLEPEQIRARLRYIEKLFEIAKKRIYGEQC